MRTEKCGENMLPLQDQVLPNRNKLVPRGFQKGHQPFGRGFKFYREVEK